MAGTRTEENHLFAMQAAIVEAVQAAVKQAEAQRVPLVDIDHLRDEIRDGFKDVRGDIAGINNRLALGEGKFEVMANRLNALERERDLREESRFRKTIGGSSSMQKAQKEPLVDPEEKPLISQKIWNAMIIAVVSALGTALTLWTLSGVLAEKSSPKDPPAATSKPTP